MSGGAGRTLTAVRMQTSAGGSWDTTSATGFWALGVARGPDGALLNQTGTMAVRVPLGGDESFTLFGADNRGRRFVPGRTLTVTATFAGGATATATTTVPSGTRGGPFRSVRACGASAGRGHGKTRLVGQSRGPPRRWSAAHGEVAESAEGDRLLSGYRVLSLVRILLDPTPRGLTGGNETASTGRALGISPGISQPIHGPFR